MKTTALIAIITFTAASFSGCSDQAAENRRAQEEAEAKARADANRREMETAPKTYQNRDYFKKNEPAKPGSEPEKSKT